jgi:signal transduction histidine kinase
MGFVTTFQSAPTTTSVAALPVMSVITHELRSPVKVTSSLLNVLSRGYVGDLNDRQADLTICSIWHPERPMGRLISSVALFL